MTVLTSLRGELATQHWVKEFEMQMPFLDMENVCPEGRIVIQTTDSAPRMLVHWDTATDLLWEVMECGSDKDFPRPCTRWVCAGRTDPARFIYVVACANNHVVMVDARQHVVLYGWSAANLLHAEPPRRPKPEAWKFIQAAQLRRARGLNKQTKHVDFLKSSCGMFALAASGGAVSLTHF